MARAKKEAALTPEERLQAALVPDWEWPYKLPENWCWTYFKSISTIQTGKKDANYGSDEGKYPFFTCAAEPIRCHGYSFDCRAILLAGNGDINNINRYNGKFEAYQRTYVVKISEPLCFDYIFYWFKYRWFDFNKGKMFGTAIPYIRLGNLQEFPTPIPPLAEQQRIVVRIESLFSKLDEAKEKAQAVVDSFETRKAAILHKAFTGELTAKWRKEHGVGMESWEVRTLDSVCSSIFDGDHMPPPKAESGIPFLVISNVNTGHLTFENTRFVPQEYYDTLSDTRKPQLGDVLYTLVGSFGIPVVVNSKRPFCFQRHMALLRPIDVSPQFLWYILQTPEMYDKASSIATGTAQLTVPIKGLRAMTIPRPNIAEQVEIVRILDGFFAREQSAKEAAEAVLDQINLMKKSILARAFRGELGTNDPSEESAVELLKQII
jgi:type I restriction enzyme S subunit